MVRKLAWVIFALLVLCAVIAGAGTLFFAYVEMQHYAASRQVTGWFAGFLLTCIIGFVSLIGAVVAGGIFGWPASLIYD